MDERCWNCRCKLTEKNTTMNEYEADRYGMKGWLCDRCAWLREKYETEKANGEYDEY